MITARKIEGRWWMPGPQCVPSYGILEFDPEKGLTLETKHAQSRAPIDVFQKSASHQAPVIHGRDEHDQPVSVFFCFAARSRGAAGLQTTAYDAGYALLGHEFPTWEEVQFDSVQIDFTHLNAWLDLPAFDQNKFEDNVCYYGYSLPEIITCPVTPDVELRILTQFTESEPASAESTLILSQRSFLELKFTSRLSMERVNHWINVIKRLLTLGVGTPVYLRELSGFRSSERTEVGDQSYARPIEVLRTNTGATSRLATKNIMTQQMLFTFADLKSSLSTAMKRWVDYAEKLNPVLDLYFSVMFNRNLYENHRFLFLAQALERYHAIQYPGTCEPEDQFDERLRRVKAVLDGNDFSFFYDKLRWSNQKVLFTRLTELIQTRKSLVVDIVAGFPNFASLVKNTRNYYTHFDPELLHKGKVAQGAALTRLVDCMRIMIEVLILDDLGMGPIPIKRSKQRAIKHIVEYSV